MKHARILNGFFIALCFLTFNVQAADDVEVPKDLPGGKVISVEEAKGMIGKATFFDMRKAVSYGKGHVKGAVALPYDQKSAKVVNFDASKDKFDMSQLPADKSKPIVFYSDGNMGWKSYKAAVTAIKAGHTNVMWMRGGTAEWEAKGLPFEQ